MSLQRVFTLSRTLKKSSSDWVENITSSRAPGKHFHSNVAKGGKTLAKHGERRVPGARAGAGWQDSKQAGEGGRRSPIGWRRCYCGYRAAAADIAAKQIEISLPSSTEKERWKGEEVKDGEGNGDRAVEWLWGCPETGQEVRSVCAQLVHI